MENLLASEIARYRELIKQLILEYAKEEASSIGDVETEVVLDEEQDHYQLIHVGWVNTSRVDGAVIHIDIRNGKVWIQHDGTPDAIAEVLHERGIPKDRIVLAFQHPRERQHSGFAAA